MLGQIVDGRIVANLTEQNVHQKTCFHLCLSVSICGSLFSVLGQFSQEVSCVAGAGPTVGKTGPILKKGCA